MPLVTDDSSPSYTTSNCSAHRPIPNNCPGMNNLNLPFDLRLRGFQFKMQRIREQMWSLRILPPSPVTATRLCCGTNSHFNTQCPRLTKLDRYLDRPLKISHFWTDPCDTSSISALQLPDKNLGKLGEVKSFTKGTKRGVTAHLRSLQASDSLESDIPHGRKGD